MGTKQKACIFSAIFIFLISAMPFPAEAGKPVTTKYYSKSRSYQGKSVTQRNQNASTTRFYDKSGSYKGRVTRQGSTVKTYNQKGRVTSSRRVKR